MTAAGSAPAALTAHLRAWVGAWPPVAGGLQVVSTRSRLEPGWDGDVRPLLGAVAPDGSGVVTVTPELHRTVAELLHGEPVGVLEDRELRGRVGEVVAGEGAVLGAGVLRWTEHVDDSLDALGTWVPIEDERVPPWLHPFGGEVLVAFDEHGAYGAGVGVKRHDPTGHELAVVTEPDHRGRGWARRLVATAARRVLEQVPVVTYLHAEDNAASAHVADAVGIPDRGWRVLGVFGGDAADPAGD